MADGSLGDRAGRADGRDAATAVFPDGSGGPAVQAPMGDRGGTTLVPGSLTRDVPARDVPARAPTARALTARAVPVGAVAVGAAGAEAVAAGPAGSREAGRLTRCPGRFRAVR